MSAAATVDKPVTPILKTIYHNNIGPIRNPICPINDHSTVLEYNPWSTHKRALKRIEKFHVESFALAKLRHDMPSSPNRNPPKKRLSNPRVVSILKTMAEIAFHRTQAADRVPLASIANTHVKTSKRYVKQLSKDLCKEETAHLRIKNMMQHEPMGIFQVANLPPKIDPT